MSKQEENTDSQYTDDFSDDEGFGVFIDNYSTRFEETPEEFTNVVNYLTEKYSLGKKEETQISETKSLETSNFVSLTKGNESKIFDDYQIKETIQKPKESTGILDFFANIPTSIFKFVYPNSSFSIEDMKKKLEKLERNPEDAPKFIDPKVIVKIFESAIEKEKVLNSSFELGIKLIFTELEPGTEILERFTPGFMIPFGFIHSAICIGPIVRN
jgi:hypothetical protein